MEYTQLGHSGVRIPEVGIGTWQYKGGVAPIRRAIELGANLVDTAEIYGTEVVVGEALQGRREQVFLATKVSGDHLRERDVLKAAGASLKRLGTDVLDLYQVHWPSERVPIAETMRAMESLVDQGKVRFIGVSNFSVRELQEAQASLRHTRIVSNQVEYSLMRRGIERDIPFYVANGITVIAYSPFARGDLFTTRLTKQGLDVLRAVAADAGKTPAQVALNWCLYHPNVIVIPKTDRVERVDEMCGASGWRLTAGQVAALDTAF